MTFSVQRTSPIRAKTGLRIWAAFLFATCLIAASNHSARAADKPAEIQPYIHAATPHGTGRLRWMYQTVYDAELWTDAEAWSWQQSFALTLRYHMSFSSEDLSDASIETMNELAPLSDQEKKSYRDMLIAFLPDVRDGDEITAYYDPGKDIRFFMNGRFTGSIQDDKFARQFLSVWFDERTPEPRLRRALLGLQ